MMMLMCVLDHFRYTVNKYEYIYIYYQILVKIVPRESAFIGISRRCFGMKTRRKLPGSKILELQY